MTRTASRIASFALVCLLAVGAVVAGGRSEPSRKERLADLPVEERVWLTEFAAPIIQPEEEKLFLELTRPEQFALFKEEFWKRRERDGLPYPMGPGYRGRYENLRRLADETFDGWREDAGKMVLRFGEPSSIDPLEGCKMTFRDLEVWTYRNSAQGRGVMRHFFYRKFPGAPRKLWTYGTSDAEVFSPQSCRKSFDSLQNDCISSGQVSSHHGELLRPDNCALHNCSDLCEVYRIYSEIRARQGSKNGADVEFGRLLAAPIVSTEGLEMLRGRMLGTLAATAPTPAPVRRASKKELLAELPDDDRVWLTEFVAPIILPEEEKLFLELRQAYERERFKREFWARRERDGLRAPFGAGYEARYAQLRRLADEVYDGWREDAGRMVLRYGEPASIHKIECENVFRNLDVWTYHNTAIYSGRVHFFLYRTQPFVPRRLWNPGVSNADIFLPSSCKQTFRSLAADCPGNASLTDRCDRVCPEDCNVFLLYQEILTRQHNAIGGEQEKARLLAPELVPLEGLDRLKGVSATAVDPNAKPLSVTGPSATVPVPAAVPAAKRSKKELLAELPEDERIWLTEFVAPIILPEEEKLFLELTAGYQREIFKKDFWARRERDGLPAPFGPGYERRYEHLREVAASDYDGLASDAGRMVVRMGEPASIQELLQCSEVYRSAEIWSYPSSAGGSSSEIRHIFYRPFLGGPRRLWMPGDTGIFQTASCLTSFDQACARDAATGAPPLVKDVFCDKGKVPRTCLDACVVAGVAEQIRGRGPAEGSLIQEAPEISTEGLDRLRNNFATLSEPNAKTIAVQGPSSSGRRPEPTPTPEPSRWLTPEEIRERILKLEPKYRQWLEMAGPLLNFDDLSRFLQLAPREKDKFIRDFWRLHK